MSRTQAIAPVNMALARVNLLADCMYERLTTAYAEQQLSELSGQVNELEQALAALKLRIATAQQAIQG
jgi:hypothetical protein